MANDRPVARGPKCINYIIQRQKMQIFRLSKNWSKNCSLLPKVLLWGIQCAKTSKFSGGCAPGPLPQLDRCADAHLTRALGADSWTRSLRSQYALRAKRAGNRKWEIFCLGGNFKLSGYGGNFEKNILFGFYGQNGRKKSNMAATSDRFWPIKSERNIFQNRRMLSMEAH